jgi:hypothetical protein
MIFIKKTMRKFIINEEERVHILSLYNLIEDFKSQKKKFIEQGYDESIVDRYLNNFREIKDKKYREAEKAEIENLNVPKGITRFNIDNYKTFKELEMLVDYVSGQRNVGNANFNDIKVNGKPIFENNDVEIYYAPNKQSCIEYKGDKPYSWCISRGDSSNMYYRYRMGGEEPSFYFVKRKKAMEQEFANWNTQEFKGNFLDKWHFFVIQVLNKNSKNGSVYNPSKSYIITSANNDGDIKTNWEGVLKIAPELQGLKEYFKNIPLTDMEKEKFEKFKKGISDEEFSKLSYSEKIYYIDSVDKKISDNKFTNLPNDLKNKYINLGFNLSDKQIELIKNDSKLIKRFQEVSNNVADNIVKNSEEMFRIPSYTSIGKNQYEQLSDNTKKNVSNLIKDDFNNFLRNWFYDNSMLKTIVNHVDNKSKINKNMLNRLRDFIPNTFFMSVAIDREEFIKKLRENPNMLFELSCYILFFKTKEELIDFLNYIGTSFDEFMKTLNKSEIDIIEKIISYKSS